MVELKIINVLISLRPKGSLLAQLRIQPLIRDRVLKAQLREMKVEKVKSKFEKRIKTPF
jgi:hypothetical protein